ncbi:MAG: HXXEE domain-containing protein [Woeseiaceae bacterium]
MIALTLCAQSLHLAEEYVYQFNLRFPALLGLTMWPETFFVAFNCAWLAVWAIAILSIAKLPRAVTFPLWFLAIASAVNGIAHPLMAIAAGGYFPGLWSSPLVGTLGFVLLRKLTFATRSKGKRRGAT